MNKGTQNSYLITVKGIWDVPSETLSTYSNVSLLYGNILKALMKNC